MEKIAFICDEVFIYWSTIILALAALTAMVTYAAVYIRKGGDLFSLSLSIFLALILSIIIARLAHWYCQADAYASFGAAMTDYSQGGFGLMGVFFGCLLTAGVLRLIGLCQNLPVMLDAMAIGGGLDIAVGRLAALFNSSDRGAAVPDSWGLPFACPVVNVVSGVQENRLATFMIQSILVGDAEQLKALAAERGYEESAFTFVDINEETYKNELIAKYVALPTSRLKEKALARRMADPLNYACVMQAVDEADVTFAGIDYTTGDVILAGQMIVGLQENLDTISSIGLCDIPGYEGSEGSLLIIGDSAVCTNPNPEQLASIDRRRFAAMNRLYGR